MRGITESFVGALFLISGYCLNAAADSLPAGTTTLDAAGIQQQIVDHTIAGRNWEEYYAPNGDIKGELNNHSYNAKWDMDESKMCFHYRHPAQDYCRTLAVNGDKVYFILENGELDQYSPSTIKGPGNMDNLGF